jgi:hypothetical protein
MGEHGFEQAERGCCIVAKKYFRLHHGLAGFNERGKMEDAVEGLSMFLGGDEKVFKRSPVGHLTPHKIHPCRQKVASAVTQIVESYCLVSRFDQ